MSLQSLNNVALEWRNFLSSIPTEVISNTSLHVLGKHSLYVLTIDLMGDNQFKFFYVGATARKNPAQRLSEHRSQIRLCRVTTCNSKSRIYDPQYMQGLKMIRLSFMIIEGGLLQDAAKERERIVSDMFRRHYGDFVLTKPVGKQSIKTS